MNLIRQSDTLAKEFLENCVEEYEIIIATKFKRSDREEYSGTFWDFEGEQNCLIDDAKEGIFKLIYEDLDSFLEGEQNCLIDDAKEGIFKLIYEDLDSFLVDKNYEVEPLSETYMVLAHKFIVAKIKALSIAQGLLGDKTYTYSNERSLEEEGVLFDIPPVVSTRNTHKSTIVLQNYVNIIAREERIIHPDTVKEFLAVDVAKKLESRYGIKKEPATILRDYLGKYPNF